MAKFLIAGNFKALRTGEHVSADQSANEFVFDSDDCESISNATLLEVGKKNKIKLGKKDKKAKNVSALVAGLEAIKLDQQNEKPNSVIVKEIIEAGLESGKDDDEMLIEIVQAGITFKLAGKLFNQLMQDGGHRVTAKDRKASIRKHLVDAEFDPETFDEVSEMLEEMQKELSDVSASQASTGLRSYAKEFEIEIPKPPKKAKGGFKAQVQEAVLKNPLMTETEFGKFCEENNKDVARYTRTMFPSIEFAQKVAQATIALQQDD